MNRCSFIDGIAHAIVYKLYVRKDTSHQRLINLFKDNTCKCIFASHVTRKQYFIVPYSNYLPTYKNVVVSIWRQCEFGSNSRKCNVYKVQLAIEICLKRMDRKQGLYGSRRKSELQKEM